MSSSIDDRIVSIQFDNAGFERNVAGTIRSLDTLKKSLNFTGAKESFADLNRASSGFSLAGMGDSVQGISNKFLALSTIAITTLATITQKAVETGITIAKSFTLKPIMDGFREYETNMNSIQTILANTTSKGSTLPDVTAALDELNTYSDKTIYNFSEMARNIGTFTAAGVDLDTSVSAIKGIANLAAISGSSSQQAATAMYQLSQAIAAGSVKLMDWNSVVNAGMGGEVFQKALFESGKALGTIKDVPITQTFEEWTDAGNTFRGSLEQGWITSEVLTNTLSGFTGDLTEAQITAMGYTKEQAAEIMKMGQVGQDAATKVKTLTQLIGTVKEAVGSGWSKTFQIVVGDFDEAKALFTSISDVLGGMVSDSADARNVLLSKWKAVGGREILIQGLSDAFKGLMSIMKPIGEAFRTIFPKKTAKDLIDMTKKFADFAARIQISGSTAFKMKRIFVGLFSAIKIGITVIKEIGRFIVEVAKKFASAGGDVDILLWRFADFFTGLREKLVDGGKIREFFDNLVVTLQKPIDFILDLKNKFVDFFDALKGAGKGSADDALGFFDRVRERFGPLGDLISGVAGAFKKLVKSLTGFEIPDFSGLAEEVGVQLGIFWENLKALFTGDDLDKTLDVINTGLFAGIVLAFKKFAAGGLNFLPNGLFGDTEGLFKGITKTFEELTGVLKAMQTDIKANALLKIAIAMAVLTASLVVLSLMDSASLTKALTATAVGFSQLALTMVALDKYATTMGAAKLTLLASAMIALAGAILILSLAMKIIASMSWEDIAKGLITVSALLLALSVSVKLMDGSTGGMIRAGIGIAFIAVALNILAIAMKIFATMAWEDIAKGLTGVGVGLGLIVAAVNLMPKGMLAKGAGLLLIGVALNLIAAAMKVFATMSWQDIGKGLTGVGGGLLLIAGAMNLMPGPQMLITGAGLVLVGFALNLIATAMKIFATMSWGELARGLTGMAGALLILAGAAYVMSGSVLGALAIGILAISLGSMFEVIDKFSKIGFKALGIGLLTLAIVLGALALAAILMAPAIGPMLALGAALAVLAAGFFLIGAGMALFGLGLGLIAKALVTLASAGEGAVIILDLLIKMIIDNLPKLMTAIAEGIVSMAKIFLDAAPGLISSLSKLIGQVLQMIIDNAPKFAEALIALVSAGLTALRAIFPQIVEVGIELLINFLDGVRQNIGEIVTIVADIIVNFLNALTEKMPELVAAGLGLLTSFLQGIADNIQLVIDAGVNIIVSVLTGIGNAIADIATAGADLVIDFLAAIKKGTVDVIAAGAKLIADIIIGMGNAAEDIVTAGVDAVLSFLEGVASNAIRLAEGAADVIIDFVNALADTIDEKAPELQEAAKKLGIAIADGVTFGLASKAVSVGKAVGGFFGGIIDTGKGVLGINSPSKVFMGMGESMAEGVVLALNNDTSAAYSAGKLAGRVTDRFRESLNAIPDLLSESANFNPVVSPVLDLTGLQKDAKALTGMFDQTALSTSISLDQANLISRSELDRQTQASTTPETTSTPEVKFEQNIYAPEALSTSDIYRQTRSQIALAKLELKIP